MNASVEPAGAAAAPESLARGELLQGGEEVILAIKPSAWFVIVASLPFLLGAVLVAGGAYILSDSPHMATSRQAVLLGCAAISLGRVIYACFQWMSHLYLLTNLRVMRMRGILHCEVSQHSLHQLEEARICCSGLERALGVGSLYFFTHAQRFPVMEWLNVARPTEVLETVNREIRKRHSRS